MTENITYPHTRIVFIDLCIELVCLLIDMSWATFRGNFVTLLVSKIDHLIQLSKTCHSEQNTNDVLIKTKKTEKFLKFMQRPFVERLSLSVVDSSISRTLISMFIFLMFT